MVGKARKPRGPIDLLITAWCKPRTETKSSYIETEKGSLKITYRTTDFERDFKASPRENDGHWINNPYILELPEGIIVRDLGDHHIQLNKGKRVATVHIGQYTGLEIQPTQITLIENYGVNDSDNSAAISILDTGRSLSELYAAYTYVKGDDSKDSEAVKPTTAKPSRESKKKMHKG